MRSAPSRAAWRASTSTRPSPPAPSRGKWHTCWHQMLLMPALQATGRLFVQMPPQRSHQPRLLRTRPFLPPDSARTHAHPIITLTHLQGPFATVGGDGNYVFWDKEKRSRLKNVTPAPGAYKGQPLTAGRHACMHCLLSSRFHWLVQLQHGWQHICVCGRVRLGQGMLDFTCAKLSYVRKK